MAKPITDPLRLDPDEISDVDLNDRQHDDISKGMPARNYRMWLLALCAIGVAGMLMWPPKPLTPKAPKVESVRGPHDQQPGDKIVTSLINDANDRKAQPKVTSITRPAGGTAYDPNVGANNGNAVGALFGQTNSGGTPQMTPEENEEARRQSIIAAGTEANEVNLAPFAARPRAETDMDRMKRDADERGKKLNDAQMKMMESLNNGTFNPGGTTGGPRGSRSGVAGGSADSSTDDGFIGRVGSRGVEPARHMTAARPGLALYQGTIVRTVLDKAINTDLPGSIRAHITSDVFDSVNGSHLMIPRGSVVIGDYSTGLVVGQDRVLAALSRLVLPNGESVSLLGTPGSDNQGVSGLAANVDNHFLQMFGSSMMIGAASLLLPKDQQNITVNMGATGGTQTGGTVLATTLQDTIKEIAQRNRNIKPTGTVDLGETFTFTLSRDIMMDEYKGHGR